MLWRLVYKFRKIIGKKKISYRLNQNRYKNIGCSIDVSRQTACLLVNPIKINSFAYVFECMKVGRASDFMKHVKASM